MKKLVEFKKIVKDFLGELNYVEFYDYLTYLNTGENLLENEYECLKNKKVVCEYKKLLNDPNYNYKIIINNKYELLILI